MVNLNLPNSPKSLKKRIALRTVKLLFVLILEISLYVQSVLKYSSAVGKKLTVK